MSSRKLIRICSKRDPVRYSHQLNVNTPGASVATFLYVDDIATYYSFRSIVTIEPSVSETPGEYIFVVPITNSVHTFRTLEGFAS